MRLLPGIAWAAAALLMSAWAPARAAEPEFTENLAELHDRLIEPGEFSRSVDRSRQHPEAVFSVPQNGYRSGRLAADLARPAGAPQPGLVIVPPPSPASQSACESMKAPAAQKRPQSHPRALYALEAGGIALGLILLGASRLAEDRKAALSCQAEPALEAACEEESILMRTWTPPQELPFSGPPRTPAPQPYVLPKLPAAAGSWKAISAEEQGAIDRWDDSAEKRLGLASLGVWLGLHACEFPRVDVPLLQDKLRREA
ncbi:MAG: hypothetical protein HY922_01780 [Elusimicrobia bacterium]|nr:hypothetical protein [Elusimicrobiota bacterium]